MVQEGQIMSVHAMRQHSGPVAAALRLVEPREDERLTLSRLPMPVDLEMYGGDDFILAVTVADEDGEPLDLEDAEVRAQARQVVGSWWAWPFLSAVAGGEIVLTLPAATTIRMPARSVWACALTLGGRTTTLMAGNVTVERGVVR